MKLTQLKTKLSFFSALLLFIAVTNCSDDDTTNEPQITVNGAITIFEATDVLSHSASKNISVEGQNLNAGMVINASDNFEVSLDDETFTEQVTITMEDANNSTNIVYVRFAPAESAVGDISGTITFESEDAESVVLDVMGEGLPFIEVSSLSLNFGSVPINAEPSVETFTVKGYQLENDISLISNEGFEISLDNETFETSLQISAANANNVNTVYVKFNPEIVGEVEGMLNIQSEAVTSVEVSLLGTGGPESYRTFNQQHLAFGSGLSQSSVQTFNLPSDLSDVQSIKMYVKLECPTGGCNDWDVYANVQVKDVASGEWYELGRYITPYGVDNHQLDRGFEIDVTDFKSMLTGNVELRTFVEVWGADGWLVTVDFDYIEGTPDYPYYAISRVIQYNGNSLQGVIYGEDASAFDLTKTVNIPANAENTHLRTIITGWGHATPTDNDGRPCAEWCFRTHDVRIDNAAMFTHEMGPIGCGQNPVQPQYGNWSPDRAGWCPGMAVPVRVDQFANSMAGGAFDFEYDFEDWTNDLQSSNSNPHAYYAISTFAVVKSNSPIEKPEIVE